MGSLADLSHTLAYVYHTWLPQSDCSLVLPLEIEAFGPHPGPSGDEPRDWDLYIPVECD